MPHDLLGALRSALPALTVFVLGLQCSSSSNGSGAPADPCGIVARGSVTMYCAPAPACGDCESSAAFAFFPGLSAFDQSAQFLANGGTTTSQDGTEWNLDIPTCTLAVAKYVVGSVGAACGVVPGSAPYAFQFSASGVTLTGSTFCQATSATPAQTALFTYDGSVSNACMPCGTIVCSSAGATTSSSGGGSGSSSGGSGSSSGGPPTCSQGAPTCPTCQGTWCGQYNWCDPVSCPTWCLRGTGAASEDNYCSINGGCPMGGSVQNECN